MGKPFAWLLIAAGALATLASAHVTRDLSHTNDFVVLFPLEVIGVMLAGIVATACLVKQRVSANAMLAVGLYTVVIGAAIGTLFPLWLPQDNTILGSALLAGVLAGVGTVLALASAVDLTRPKMRAAFAGGALAFVLVTAGGMVSPLAQLHLPLVVTGVVGVFVARITWHQHIRSPLLQMLAGSVITIALLAIRGPDDWASASSSLKLYSFPILIVALGISLAMLQRRTQP